MKSFLIITGLLLVSSASSAGSYPIKLRLIGSALSSSVVQNAKLVRTLRDQGEVRHNSGEHGSSVEIFEKAIELGKLHKL